MWWWTQKPCLLSLALWGQSLYGKLQCIPLIHFHGEKSIKAFIHLQQLLQDDVFVRPFKQNGQYIPNTPRQDRSVVGVWSFPKAFYCIKLITELSQPPFKNLKAHRVSLLTIWMFDSNKRCEYVVKCSSWHTGFSTRTYKTSSYYWLAGNTVHTDWLQYMTSICIKCFLQEATETSSLEFNSNLSSCC